MESTRQHRVLGPDASFFHQNDPLFGVVFLFQEFEQRIGHSFPTPGQFSFHDLAHFVADVRLIRLALNHHVVQSRFQFRERRIDVLLKG
jgi:hypothetical protein